MNNHLATAYACDGTAALAPEPARFVIVEGGLAPAAREPRERARLAPGQVALAVAATLALFAALLLASLAADSLARAGAAASLAQAPKTTVVVEDGDTLWAIASASGVEGCTTSEVVDWIQEENGLDGALLHAGQRLVVPAGAR